MLGVISPPDIDRTWSVCSPMLARAMKNGESNYSMSDIKTRLRDGRFQLWAWAENNKIIACAVTEILIFPTRKICSVLYVGGQGLKIWRKTAVNTVAEWAKKNGCTDMEGYVRKGWLRILPDWRTAWTTIRRSL